MEPYRQQIEDLLIDEQLGTISEPNRQLLDSLLAAHPDAQAIREEVKAAFQDDRGQHALHLPEQPVEGVFAHGRQKKIRTRIRVISSIAAAAAVLLLVYFRFMPSGSLPTAQPTAPLAAINNKHIRLTLANGETVDLSNSGPQVQVNNVTVHNQQHTLSFSDVPPSAQWATLVVPVGKDYKVNLADGSEVWLNSATSIRFPLQFTGNTREVTINGEAYVKVAPHADKPFILHLPHSTVHVLGTEFNVNTYDSGQTRLALVKGAVNVALPRQTVSVKPGFQLVASPAAAAAQEPFDPKVILGWREGIYIYQNASLQELGRILNRWFGVDVVLDNEEVTSMRFNGVIHRDDKIEEYLSNLEYTNGPAYYIKDKVVHFK
ncbi:FecR family protein [Chitinophaga costaii]|uniref:FecR family protein n=1 Tax=Chitinophaga costaii TaxID=1335309 RepID=A0A1C4DFM1_9BACT|nr:FecR family protein [Chitinophaga costaii]PUZ24611.1 FecR family protein [Chitinophaga costaii]SCC30141.1 FecR family protein [Chitinophaga costaii]